MDNLSIGAIILTAGESSRMGTTKALLPLNGKTILEEEIAFFHNFGIKHIVVVTGYHAEEIRHVIYNKGVIEAHNAYPEKGMFSSVCVGVNKISRLCSGFFLLPVDIPLVRFCTLKLLHQTWLNDPSKIVIPYFKDKSGHPPLFPASIIPSLLSWSGEQGLHGFLSAIAKDIIYVPVPDEHMLLDMDTPEDYKKIKQRAMQFNIPTREECSFVLDNVHPVPPNIRAHSIAISKLSLAISKKLNEKGIYIDNKLIEASGLLHDIARLEPHHAQKGAQLLDGWGFPLIADIIRNHMDLNVSDNDPITASEIVFIADKYVAGNQVVNPEDRYKSKIEKYSQNPEAKVYIMNRLNHALKSRRRIEKIIGKSLFSLAKKTIQKNSL